MSYLIYLSNQVPPDIYDMINNSHLLPPLLSAYEGDIFSLEKVSLVTHKTKEYNTSGPR